MDLAKELNDALFEIADDPDCKCTRIAFKGGELMGQNVTLEGCVRNPLRRGFERS